MFIDSPANPTVKALRSLELARHRQERGLFLVEGVRAVEEGLRAGFWPEVCIYNGDLLKRVERGAKLLREIHGARKQPAPIEASERAMQAASATQHPQGIVAAFPFIEWPDVAPHPGDPALGLVCDDIGDPGNLGTILRAAEAAGAHAVWLSPKCVNMYNPKVVRAAMGAHFRLPVYAAMGWADIEAALRAFSVQAAQTIATGASAGQLYDSVDWTQPSALIISNEAHGLSKEARSLAGGMVSIPMAGGTESLNAATAAAVILFEAARQRRSRRI